MRCRTEEKPENRCLRVLTRPTAQRQNGLLASLNSVAKLPYEDALDGISNTQTINPGALGHDADRTCTRTWFSALDGYFDQGAHHSECKRVRRRETERCNGTS